MSKVLRVVLVSLAILTVLAWPALAQGEAAGPGGELGTGAGIVALGAALAVGLGAFGTAWAQARIGSAAAGALAERPEIFVSLLIFMILPETIVILGFLVAFLVIPGIR